MNKQPVFYKAIRLAKNIYLWLSIVFGVALSLTLYQEIWTAFFSTETSRLQILSCAFVFVCIAACFYAFEAILLPRFGSFSKAQKMGLIFLSTLAPLILAVAVLNKDFFDKTIYFLLPSRVIQIEVLDKGVQNGKIALTGIYAQPQGSISFDALQLKGWERKGNQIILVNATDNQIAWKGKAGYKTSLTFKFNNNAPKIKAYWDSADATIYNPAFNNAKETRISRNFDVPLYASWATLAVAYYLSAIFATFFLSTIFVAFSGFSNSASLDNKKAWIFYALPMCAVWMFYLLVFWPGFMTADSITQWQEVNTGKFVHANPVMHTLTVWLITRIWFSPAAVAFVQIIVLSGALGWGVATLRQFGAPNWLAWLTAITLALSPANSALSITLWKDILFSAMVVLLTVSVFKIMATNGEWLKRKTNWIALGVVLTFVCWYRLNGILVAFLTLATTAWVYKKYWRALVKAAVLFLVLYYPVTNAVFRALNVEFFNMARSELVATQMIAGYMKAGTSFSLEEQKVLNSILPEPWAYNCYRNEALLFNPNLNWNYMTAHSREITSIALNAIKKNPLIAFRHLACQGASVYRIPEEYPNEKRMLGIYKNEYGLKPSSKLSGAYPLLLRFLIDLTDARSRNAIWLVWRAPFWMYLSAFACAVFCIRNKTWKPLVILLPGLATVLPYLVLALGQIFRYLYAIYLIGILFSGYFLTCALTRQSSPESADTQPALRNLPCLKTKKLRSSSPPTTKKY